MAKLIISDFLDSPNARETARKTQFSYTGRRVFLSAIRAYRVYDCDKRMITFIKCPSRSGGFILFFSAVTFSDFARKYLQKFSTVPRGFFPINATHSLISRFNSSIISEFDP